MNFIAFDGAHTRLRDGLQLPTNLVQLKRTSKSEYTQWHSSMVAQAKADAGKGKSQKQAQKQLILQKFYEVVDPMPAVKHHIMAGTSAPLHGRKQSSPQRLSTAQQLVGAILGNKQAGKLIPEHLTATVPRPNPVPANSAPASASASETAAEPAADSPAMLASQQAASKNVGPASESVADLAAMSASEPAAVSASEPAAVSASEPAAVSASDPAAFTAIDLAAASAAEPDAIPAAAAVSEPSAKVVAMSASQTASEAAGRLQAAASSAEMQAAVGVTAEELQHVGTYKPGRGRPRAKGPPNCGRCHTCQQPKLKHPCLYKRTIAGLGTPDEAELLSKACNPTAQLPADLLAKLAWLRQHQLASGLQPAPTAAPSASTAAAAAAATTTAADAQSSSGHLSGGGAAKPTSVNSPQRVFVKPKYREQPLRDPLATPPPKRTQPKPTTYGMCYHEQLV